MTSPQDGGARAYHVVHSTRYTYSEPVAASLHSAVLVMRETPCQTVRYSRIQVDPEPLSLTTSLDYFGNNVTRFTIETPASYLRVTSENEVALRIPRAPDLEASVPLGAVGRQLHGSRRREDLDALEFVFDSRYVRRSDELGAYARKGFSAEAGLLAGVAALMHRIHREFRYDPAVTEVSTPVEEVLARREGVCQDFAHVMIACLRSIRVPARYVSGYLVPLPGVVGSQASHAWVSAYAPGVGWVDFDPTNDVIPAGGHLTVGWGRDYGDVSPLRGVVLGGGEHSIRVSVEVEEMPVAGQPEG